MQILYGPDFFINSPTVVTIGKFDGLHDGHLKVIYKVKEVAKDYGLKSVVYTFNRNPKLVLNNEKFSSLMSNEEKSEKLDSFGVDYLVYEEFNEKFYNMLPIEFVEDVLVGKLNVKAVVMGENSTFGKDKKGDVRLMKELGEKFGFEVIIVELLKENGEVISSTNIRERKKLLAVE